MRPNTTMLAVQEFHDFARMWVPPAVREQIWDPRRNPVASMVKAIKAIDPPSEPIGYGVYSRVYTPENRSRIEYVQTSLVFEASADHALEYCRTKQPRDDFVICELREVPVRA